MQIISCKRDVKMTEHNCKYRQAIEKHIQNLIHDINKSDNKYERLLLNQDRILLKSILEEVKE